MIASLVIKKNNIDEALEYLVNHKNSHRNDIFEQISGMKCRLEGDDQLIMSDLDITE